MSGYQLQLLAGAWVTLQVALSSMLGATVIGALVAVMRLTSSRWLRGLGMAYTDVVRGVPELVLMLLFFYGGQAIVNQIAEVYELENLEFNEFSSGVLTISFIYGAYVAETFRGAALAVPKGQTEAALACGLPRWRIFIRILCPQVFRLALPAYINNWLVLTKATALVSVIGLADMMRAAREIGGATHEPFTYLLAVGAYYLVLTTVSLLGLQWVERHLSRGMAKVVTRA